MIFQRKFNLTFQIQLILFRLLKTKKSFLFRICKKFFLFTFEVKDLLHLLKIGLVVRKSSFNKCSFFLDLQCLDAD